MLGVQFAHNQVATADPGGWRLVFAKAGLLLLCFETILSVPYRSVFLAVHSIYLSWLAVFCVAIMVTLLYKKRTSVLARLSHFADGVRISERTWLLFWLVAGLIVRLLWVLLLNVTLKSDGLAYFTEAKSLALDHTYVGAFWPPGYPLFLSVFFMLFGPHVWVTDLCAILLFVATYGVTCLLARNLGGDFVSRIAPVLVAVWPTFTTLAGVNCKETLLAFIVPLSLLLYLHAATAQRTYSVLLIAGSGLLIGFAALTQPGFLLFPSVILGIEAIRRTPLMQAIGRIPLILFAMAVAILPWTYRNYVVYHRVVLISTNGGSVFYRANNPKANASYSAEGEVVLPKDEFAADKQGYTAAEHWITHNPVAFLTLAARKQIVYLGDDGIGVYESMKRDLNPPAKLYALAKIICNAFWLACWVIVLLGSTGLFGFRNWRTWVGICLLPLIYQWAIDSIFESGSRHHVPYIPLISILVALALDSAPRLFTPEENETVVRVSQSAAI